MENVLQTPLHDPALPDDGFWGGQLDAEPDSIAWLWEGYLAGGDVTLLTSQWKSGKTSAMVCAARGARTVQATAPPLVSRTKMAKPVWGPLAILKARWPSSFGAIGHLEVKMAKLVWGHWPS